MFRQTFKQFFKWVSKRGWKGFGWENLWTSFKTGLVEAINKDGLTEEEGINLLIKVYVEKIMDEMNIWEKYDEIMLKKAENRWDRKPKKGNEKNIFEELLIKREQEENKAKG